MILPNPFLNFVTMKSRQLTASDYEILCEWWEEWGWAVPPPKSILSDLGVMITLDGINVCAGYLYLISTSKVAWFSFPVSNPIIRKSDRKDALRMLVREIEKLAKEHGVVHLYSALRNQNMIDVQKQEGYVANSGYTELIKNL